VIEFTRAACEAHDIYMPAGRVESGLGWMSWQWVGPEGKSTRLGYGSPEAAAEGAWEDADAAHGDGHRWGHEWAAVAFMAAACRMGADWCDSAFGDAHFNPTPDDARSDFLGEMGGDHKGGAARAG
jgi:hypothetical protein